MSDEVGKAITRAEPRPWISTRMIPALTVAILLQLALTGLWQLYSPLAFRTIGGVPVTGPPVAVSAATYGTPFPEGAFECDEWTWYEHRGGTPYLECPQGHDRTTFVFPAFVLNLAATLVPLAFIARRLGRWTPLIAVPAFVIVATVARGRFRIAADTIDDTTGPRMFLLVVWLGTVTITAALAFAWHKLMVRRMAAASPSDGTT